MAAKENQIAILQNMIAKRIGSQKLPIEYSQLAGMIREASLAYLNPSLARQVLDSMTDLIGNGDGESRIWVLNPDAPKPTEVPPNPINRVRDASPTEARTTVPKKSYPETSGGDRN